MNLCKTMNISCYGKISRIEEADKGDFETSYYFNILTFDRTLPTAVLEIRNVELVNRNVEKYLIFCGVTYKFL